MAAAYSLGRISGAHLNAAVSLGMVAAGRMEIGEALLYAVAQIVGASAGWTIATGQLWLFILAPCLGALVAGALFKAGLTQADEVPANMVKAQPDLA